MQGRAGRLAHCAGRPANVLAKPLAIGDAGALDPAALAAAGGGGVRPVDDAALAVELVFAAEADFVAGGEVLDAARHVDVVGEEERAAPGVAREEPLVTRRVEVVRQDLGHDDVAAHPVAVLPRGRLGGIGGFRFCRFRVRRFRGRRIRRACFAGNLRELRGLRASFGRDPIPPRTQRVPGDPRREREAEDDPDPGGAARRGVRAGGLFRALEQTSDAADERRDAARQFESRDSEGTGRRPAPACRPACHFRFSFRGLARDSTTVPHLETTEIVRSARAAGPRLTRRRAGG